MDNKILFALFLVSLMLLPGLSLNDQNTLNASRGVSDTNAATLFTEGQSSIDGFTTYNRSYDFANYSLQNLDYNISTSRGYAGSVINMANNFTGAYYVQNNGTFVKQNFITGKIVFLAKSPLLYLRYSYLNYNGEYFGEMPYYNSSNVLKWIFIYGINPANYFEMWGYNLVNDTVINYTELNLQMSSQSNSNFQLTYVGDGNFIGIGNGESNYYVWNVYRKQLVYSSLVPFTDVEANNIYYIPQYRQYLDVFADGTTNDNLQYGTVSYSGIINSIRTITTGDTYQINGVFDIVVDVRTNDIWINDGGANYGLIVILHWNGTSFELVSSKFTSSDRKGQFNNYALENNYVPIVTANGYVQSGVGGWGSPDQFFINEFNRTSLNITGLSGNDIKWAYGMPYGNGASIGISLPEFNGSSLDSSYYGMWINTSSPSPHVFYVWNSSEPKSIANYIDRKEPGIYYVNIEESGLPEGSLWSYTFNGTQYALSNTSYSYALPTGNYSLHVNSIAGYNLSYPKTVVIQNKNVMVNVEFSKPKYRVTFLENGLLFGEWGIKINGGEINTKLHSININLEKGTYKFNIFYPSKLYNSNLTVGDVNVNGKNLTIYISFKYSAHNITFEEVGLPDSVQWSMQINGTLYKSNISSGNRILFLAKNGSYTGLVNSASNISPVKGMINFTVSGNEIYSVDYLIRLTFAISGYNGSWHMYVNGKELFSNTSSISVIVSPGTVHFTIGNVSGYTIAPQISTKSYTESQTISILFTPQPPSLEKKILSSPLLSVEAIITMVLLGSILYIILKKRKT